LFALIRLRLGEGRSDTKQRNGSEQAGKLRHMSLQVEKITSKKLAATSAGPAPA